MKAIILLILILSSCTYTELVDKPLQIVTTDSTKHDITTTINIKSKTQKEEKRYPIDFSVTIKEWN